MLTFFGTSPRSALFLEQAIQNGLKVDLVVSDPPKPIGKKQILTENPTVTMAKRLNISFLQSLSEIKCVIPTECNEWRNPFPPQDERKGSFDSPATAGSLRMTNTLGRDDIGIILDFNKIIPNEIINLFPKGIINVHFSKLPQYRGPAPVQYTILNGDRQAWVTYYLIAEKIDAGKIIAQTSLPLDMTETTETLYQKLIAKSAGEISFVIDEYLSGRSNPRLQKGTATYTKKLTWENCQIDWTKSPAEIDRLIRAAFPEPGAWCFCRPEQSDRSRRDSSVAPQNDNFKKSLKILKAHLENGKLILDQVQFEGKKPVTWKQFTEGYPEAEMAQTKVY